MAQTQELQPFLNDLCVYRWPNEIRICLEMQKNAEFNLFQNNLLLASLIRVEFVDSFMLNNLRSKFKTQQNEYDSEHSAA